MDREGILAALRARFIRPETVLHLRLASTGENRWRLTPVYFAIVLLAAQPASPSRAQR